VRSRPSGTPATGLLHRQRRTGGTCDPNDPHCNDATPRRHFHEVRGRGKVGDACGGSTSARSATTIARAYDPGPPEVKGHVQQSRQSRDDSRPRCSALPTARSACGATTPIPPRACARHRLPAACPAPPIMLAPMGSIAWGWRSTIKPAICSPPAKCGPFLDVGKSCSADGESGCPFDTACDAGRAPARAAR